MRDGNGGGVFRARGHDSGDENLEGGVFVTEFLEHGDTLAGAEGFENLMCWL